jgi:hypothetical protein
MRFQCDVGHSRLPSRSWGGEALAANRPSGLVGQIVGRDP